MAHRDRRVHLGYDWFAYCAQPHGCEMVVTPARLSPSQAMREALRVMVHTFSCCQPGLRRRRQTLQEGTADG